MADNYEYGNPGVKGSMLARVSIRLCCGEYRIEDELEIMDWQTTRSGEIKTSRRQRHPAGVHFENLESEKRWKNQTDERWGHVLSQTEDT